MRLSVTALLFTLVFAATLLGIGYFNSGWDVGYTYGLLPQDVVFISAGSVMLFVAFLYFDIRAKRSAQWVIAILFVAINVVLPMIWSIGHRRQSLPHMFVHDNPLQVEAAVDFLLQGKNPYGRDYSQTSMGQWVYGVPIFDFQNSPEPEAIKKNPALSHLAPLPFSWLVMLPAKLFFELILGWFDARMAYLLAYLGMIAIGLKLIVREKRLDFFILFAANPLLAGFLIVGHNDILVGFLLVSVLAFASKKHWLWSAILLGLALATKQTALPFAALYAAYLLAKSQSFKLPLAVIGLAGLVAASFILPFIFWDQAAFIRDTVGYISGGLATSYPIKGIGLSMTALVLGLVPNSLAPFPAGILQVIIGLPILFWAGLNVRRFPTLASLCTWFMIVYVILLFLSRFFNDSYLGLAVGFLLLGYYLPEKEIG